MIHEFVDMDTQEKVRYVSESSNASTSGYSTMSPGPFGMTGNNNALYNNGNLSPNSSVFSMPPSPAQSPATVALQTEFSNLNLPSNSPQQTHYAPMQQQQQQNVYGNYMNYTSGNTAANGNIPQQLYQQQQYGGGGSMISTTTASTMSRVKSEYPAELHIIEQPVEKFRFRYKSEMHGTHGSLNGANSKRSPKTYPEVELRKFNGRAIIRCSLFQTNLDSPHSHQLVVRKDDADICDPHDLHVSPEHGFVAQFLNMGIIHTAKKFIYDELYKKKLNRMRFDVGRDELSTKQLQELHKQTEKEAKDMNLNQVRLCFEAFKIETDQSWTRIAAPVYTNPINNRKSAQTGELRISRLSIATGNVTGGDDLILLVEKVSKKNIKVRFYEHDEDDELIWEAFGRFRESDVHHQYAIVCQTPAYKNKDIDKPVEVMVELVRPSDDERSFPAVTFRYKPRDAIVSRKRRRTCSTATSSSGSGSSLNSYELPKTLQEQQLNVAGGTTTAANTTAKHMQPGGIRISEEFNKDKLLDSADFKTMITYDSEELTKLITGSDYTFFNDMLQDTQNDNMQGAAATSYVDPNTIGRLETDGVPSSSSSSTIGSMDNSRHIAALNRVLNTTTTAVIDNRTQQVQLQRIFNIYDRIRNVKDVSNKEFTMAANEISDIYTNYAEKNENNDSIMHEIIMNDNTKLGIKTCHILNYFKLNELFNRVLNLHNQSPLHYACLYDRALYIRPLLGLGCDPNIQDQRGNNTALHIAVMNEHSKCVQSFLNTKNIEINLALRNDEGVTPLHMAIRLKAYDIAKKLLQFDKSATLVANTKDGNNALHMAIRQQNLELIQFILHEADDKSALLASRNTAGHTALNLAISLNTKIGNEIVRVLTALISNADEPTNLIIKEEEMSSSSTEDDDIDEGSLLDSADIKEEFPCDEEDNEEVEDNDVNKNLSEILNNEHKFRKLVKILSEQQKWKKLAVLIGMKQRLVLWSNAEIMLTHMRHDSSIKYQSFVEALREIDHDALEILLL